MIERAPAQTMQSPAQTSATPHTLYPGVGVGAIGSGVKVAKIGVKVIKIDVGVGGGVVKRDVTVGETMTGVGVKETGVAVEGAGVGVGVVNARVGGGVRGVVGAGDGNTLPGEVVKTGVMAGVWVGRGLVTVSELFWQDVIPSTRANVNKVDRTSPLWPLSAGRSRPPG